MYKYDDSFDGPHFPFVAGREEKYDWIASSMLDQLWNNIHVVCAQFFMNYFMETSF